MKEMDVKEVSEYTNFSPKTIYNFVYLKKIPFRRISRKKVVFYKEEIDAWLRKRSEDSELTEMRIKESIKKFWRRAGVDIRNLFEKKLIIKRRIVSLISVSFVILIAIFCVGWLSSYKYYRSKGVSGELKREQSSIYLDKILNDKSAVKPVARNSRIEDVQISPIYFKEGEVQIKYKQILDVEFTGNLLSTSVFPFILDISQNQEQDYALRSKAIDVVMPFADNIKIREMLIAVMKTDKNTAIRLKALTVLSKVVHKKEVKDAILDRLLNDQDQSLRFKALEIVEEDVDEEVLSAINRVRGQEKSEIIRKRAELIYKNHMERKT